MKVELIACTSDPQSVIEEAGRTCYLSFDQIGADSADSFIRKAIARGHESILEHASATFRVIGGSRVFTHQQVRHRIASFSQQSQRYVNEDEFDYVIPPSIMNNPEACAEFISCIEQCRQSYKKLRSMNILKEDARYVLPNALESEIVVTMNFRELRHLFHLRGEKCAQWEFRAVCRAMHSLICPIAPAVFDSCEIDPS